MPQVVKAQNPRVLLVPAVASLVQRACASVDFGSTATPGAIAEEMFNHITQPGFFFLLGFEGADAKAMACGFYPSSYLFPYPVISIIYNEGTPDMRKAMVDAIFKEITSNGYAKAWAINGTDHSDGAWVRGLVPKDKVEARRIGTVFEFGVR